MLFIAIGAFATVASHLLTTRGLPHTFSPLFFFSFLFFFSTTQSRLTTTHNIVQIIYHSRVPWTWTSPKEEMSQVDRGWSKGRRGGWNPNRCIDPSSRPPSSMLIRSVNVDHGRLIRIGSANALFIDRDIDGDRDAKIKPKSVLSCLKRILDDFTSTIGTATSHLSSFYRSVPLSIINDNIHTSHSSINFFLHVTFEILPCSFFHFALTCNKFDSLASEMRGRGEGRNI